MADKLRSVNTMFWKDPWVAELDSTEKLLFLYLLTNPMTNILGVYEINTREIAFDTGIDKESILRLFERFKNDGKVDYFNQHVILINFLKNQHLNSNMIIGAQNIFNDLKAEVSKYIVTNYYKAFESLLKPLKAFESLREKEIEKEKESEIEKEKENKEGFDLLILFNELTKRKFRILDQKARRQLHQRIREGFTPDDFAHAITNCMKDPFHQANPNHLTPEFITRSDKLQKYINYNATTTKDSTKSFTGNGYAKGF